MTCEQMRDNLSAYLDGQFSPKEAQAARQHLQGCPDCSEELEALRQVQNALINMPEVPAPEELHAGGMARIRALKKPFYRRPAAMGGIAAAVACLALVGVLFNDSISGYGAGQRNSTAYDIASGYSGGEGGYTMNSMGVAMATSAPAPAAMPMADDMSRSSAMAEMEKQETAVYEDRDYGSNLAFTTPPTQPQAGIDPAQSPKIIYTGDVSLSTAEFDQARSTLYGMIDGAQGYLENENQYGLPFSDPNGYGRSLSLTVRVPAEGFDSFYTNVQGIGQSNSASRYMSDITAAYTDTEMRLHVLKLQLERLEELIAKSEKIDDVLAVQAQMTDLVYQIESHQGTLRRFDMQVGYATLHINVNETQRDDVVYPVPTPLGERITNRLTSTVTALRDAAEGFVIWLVGTLPVTLPLAVIALVVGLVVRFKVRKSKEKRV